MPTATTTPSQSSKKRKRGPSLSEGVSFELSSHPHVQGGVGPMLVSFPALEAPASIPFRCYARKKTQDSSEDAATNELAEGGMLVVGETNSVEFVTNEEESRKVANAGCRYLLALHNPRASSLTVLPTPVSPHILTRNVKALKSLPSAAPSALQYREARTALGETFGTKKSKAAIRARERNRVDVGAMEGVVGYLMDGIEKGAGGLMNSEEAKTTADSNRLIPPFSTAATDPADVYPLHDIIPEAEWKALSVSALEETKDKKERAALLPFRWSSWINAHLGTETGGKGRKKTLKILFYISSMLAFRRVTEHKVVEKDQVYEKLAGVPSVVIDSLLARFSEVPRGSTGHHSTTTTQTRLLTHVFALCLRVDGYATDSGLLANDLSLALPKVNQLFKTLGCKIAKLSERERARLGLPDSSAETKRAMLTAPVVFPKQRMKRRAT